MYPTKSFITQVLYKLIDGGVILHSSTGGNVPYDKYYHDKKEGDQYRGAKIAMRVIGIILLFIGFAIALSGRAQSDNVSMGDDDWFEESSAGSEKTFIGIAMMMFGFFLIGVSFARKISHYSAVETKPAMITASEGIGTGIVRGLKQEGGIPINVTTQGQHAGAPREVVKIKCRACGYLDSEDATFCSKCGKKL